MLTTNCQIVTLLTMLRLHGPAFVEIGQTLQTIRERFAQSAILRQEDRCLLMGQLNHLLESCQSMRLSVSSQVLRQYIEEMQDDGELTYSRVAQRLSHWESPFFAELSQHAFFQLPISEATYFCDSVSVGEEIQASIDTLGAFNDAAFDVKEGGRCIALDRPTAAVYHLMRAAEYGLVAVAASIGVPAEKRTSWEAMIGSIHGEIKAKVSRKEPNYKQDEKKYDDLCAWFTTIKNGWRNPASHVPISYSLNTAKGMFSATRTLFEHLSIHGISPCPMPGEIIALPDVLSS